MPNIYRMRRIDLNTCNLQKPGTPNILFNINVAYEKKSGTIVENSFIKKQDILNKIAAAYNNLNYYKLFVYCCLHHS
ncbi:hypothetical protein ACVW2L_000343 [Mucilaginibacter sp. HD30]